MKIELTDIQFSKLVVHFQVPLRYHKIWTLHNKMNFTHSVRLI